MSPWTLAYWWGGGGGGGGMYFLFETSDLQMLMLWHDFPAFFLHFFGKSYLFMRLLENKKFPNYSQAKYANLEAFMSRSAKWLGSSPPPPPFWKSVLKRKRMKGGEKKSDLPMSQIR